MNHKSTRSAVKENVLVQSFITSISMGVFIVGISKLLSFILKILVSQLGVINFSDYYLATATFTGLTTIAALGIPMSTTRFISYLNGKREGTSIHKIVSSAATIVIAASCIVGFILYQYATPLAVTLGTAHIAQYLRILSFGLVGSTITLLARAVFLGYIRVRLAYTAEAIDIICKFIFTIVGVLTLRWGVLGALIGYTIGTLTAAGINTVVLKQVSGIRKFTPHISQRLLRYALPVSGSEIITAAANIAFLYIIRVRGGAETVGFYAAAISIAALLHVVPQMVLSVYLPVASSMFAQKQSVLPAYITLIKWLGIAVLIPSSVFLFLSSRITVFLFGASFIEASTILQTLVAAYGIYALMAWPNRQLLDMAGYTKENLVLTFLRIGISTCVLFLFIREFTGLALAQAILWGWVGESVGSLGFVKLKKII